jgi:hypothetical protein
MVFNELAPVTVPLIAFNKEQGHLQMLVSIVSIQNADKVGVDPTSLLDEQNPLVRQMTISEQ